eukprot:gene31265-biopygen32737
MSYQECLSTVLSPKDQEDVLRTFDSVEDSSDDELPAGDDLGEGASDEDEEGELDLAEPEIADSRLAFECPSGFSVIEKPAALISSVQGLKDLFIAMLWKEEGWELGKTLRNPILEVSWGVSHPQVLASHPERDLFLWKVGAEAERVG